ncbi:MAG: GH1 family beta-glucosidase [Bacillota bacterium]
MEKLDFAEDFTWGAATASYQIEGAYAEDGKGESIWDRFTHEEGKILNGDTGDEACDHYHRYEEDVELMQELGLDAYRFSISWPRVLPQGKGEINQEGLKFYSDLVDRLIAADIEPVVTLYHWDLPQALQEEGGWANRDVVEHFVDYAEIIFSELGDRVKSWITLNEPWVVAFLGNASGVHAPGLKDYKTALEVAHNLLLSHGMTVKKFRELNLGGEIGITLNLSSIYPASESDEDKKAAELQDAYLNRWFLQPLFKGSYPEQLKRAYQEQYERPLVAGHDMEVIGQEIDFLGINYYTRNVVEYAPEKPVLKFKSIDIEDKPKTEMGWEVYPPGLYELLVRLNQEFTDKPLYITENGAAFPDEIDEEGTIEDQARIDYLQEHFKMARQAIAEGVPLQGYFVWSLMDNFEWAYGYSKRFGLIYIDYETKKRYLKDSAYWYRDFLAEQKS